MFADPEWFTCIKDTIPRTKMQEKRALFLHAIGAEGAAFLPGDAGVYCFAQKRGAMPYRQQPL